MEYKVSGSYIHNVKRDTTTYVIQLREPVPKSTLKPTETEDVVNILSKRYTAVSCDIFKRSKRIIILFYHI